MPIEKRPTAPLPPMYVPPDSKPYKVKDGDSWVTVARANSMDPWDLIFANFKTRDPAEVNWYLRRSVGCNRSTRDMRNWMFTSSADPGIIHIPVRVVRLPPPAPRPAATPSRWGRVWAGLGKSHSGDFFVIGAHDLTAKVYNLGDALSGPTRPQNAWINVNGWKFGAGLGADVGGVFVIAHGFGDATEMNGVKGDWDFDLALGARLADFLKGVQGLGKAVDTIEKYQKLRYLTENAIKNIGIAEEGIYTIPIPYLGMGLHIWGGYKFGDVTVVRKGTGLP